MFFKRRKYYGGVEAAGAAGKIRREQKVMMQWRTIIGRGD